MKIVALKVFQAHVQSIQRSLNIFSDCNRKLLSLDFGTKAIGLAISDESCQISAQFGTYRRQEARNSAGALEHASKYFSEIVIKENIGGIIMGLPIQDDNGKDPLTPFCYEAISFMQRLNLYKLETNPATGEQALNVDLLTPCTMWNESGSTAKIRRTSKLMSNKRSFFLKRKDTAAAMLIMQSFLDYHNGVQPE